MGGRACWARTADWWHDPHCIARGDEGTTEDTAEVRAQGLQFGGSPGSIQAKYLSFHGWQLRGKKILLFSLRSVLQW